MKRLIPPLRSSSRILLSLLVALVFVSPVFGEESFIRVANLSGQVIKVAAPGSKSMRIPPGEDEVMIPLEVTEPNGIEVKAWWVSKPRELCVIFVRYEGLVKVAGKSTIRCLGN